MHTPARRATTATALTATLAAALLALTGCSLLPGIGGGAGSDIPDGTTLHPTGDAGAWMLDGYAQGTDGAWATQDLVCGITADGVAIHRDTSDVVTVVATDMRTDTELWRLETLTAGGAGCGALHGDRMHVFESEIDASGQYRSVIARVDLATGERTTIYEAPIDIRIFEAFGVSGDTVFATASASAGDVLMALDGVSQIIWQSELPPASQCSFVAEHIACVTLDGDYVVLEAATGSETASGRVEQPTDTPTWGSDGFVLTTDRVSFTEATYTAYRYDGSEIGEVDGRTTPLPGPNEGVFYAIEDHAWWTVQTVDAAGSPITRLPTGFGNDEEVIATGEPLPAATFAVSADGQTIGVGGLGDPTHALVKPDGDIIEELGEPYRVMNGYLVSDDPSSTMVLFPAG